MKVKIFYAVNNIIQTNSPVKDNTRTLQKAVSEWIQSENPALTREPLQSASGRLDSHVTLTFIYE